MHCIWQLLGSCWLSIQESQCYNVHGRRCGCIGGMLDHRGAVFVACMLQFLVLRRRLGGLALANIANLDQCLIATANDIIG